MTNPLEEFLDKLDTWYWDMEDWKSQVIIYAIGLMIFAFLVHFVT